MLRIQTSLAYSSRTSSVVEECRMAENPEKNATTNGAVIGVVKESVPGETRVGLIPDSVKHLTGKGLQVLVQAGAGEGSSISDSEYEQAGARIVPSIADVHASSDVVVRVQAPAADRDELSGLKQDQILVSFLAPLVNHDLNREMASSGVTAMAVDAVPRITRAQSMDALSAMSTIGGYKAVLLAAEKLPKFFPLLMTAAGTIRPAKVLVLGAGVAGLQAIATARRLGAVVEAYDARPVVKEQVESLGAKFVEIDTGGSNAETTGGYAREATPEELRRQQEGLNEHIANSDVVITTALVPGRPAPLLIPAVAVERMRHGSVIVDLAAETGGNCELTTPGEVTREHGVTIIGTLNLPATLPVHASQMYAKVITNFLDLLVKDGAVNLDFEDEIIANMCITNRGEIVQAQTRKLMGLEESAAAAAPVVSESSADAGSSEADTITHESNVDLEAVYEPDAFDIADSVDHGNDDADFLVSDDGTITDVHAADLDSAKPAADDGTERQGASSLAGGISTDTHDSNIDLEAVYEPDAFDMVDSVTTAADDGSRGEPDASTHADNHASASVDPEETDLYPEMLEFDSSVKTPASSDSAPNGDDDADAVYGSEEPGLSFGPGDDIADRTEDVGPGTFGARERVTASAEGVNTSGWAGSAAPRKSSRLPQHGEGTDWVAGSGTRDVPDGFPIKGNANSNLYHPETSPNYQDTIAEILFASADAAEAHGYRLPKGLARTARKAVTADNHAVVDVEEDLIGIDQGEPSVPEAEIAGFGPVETEPEEGDEFPAWPVEDESPSTVNVEEESDKNE